MIITKIEPPFLSMSFADLVKVDTKANLLEAAALWGVNVRKSWSKDAIAGILDAVLHQDVELVWNNLGSEAIFSEIL